MVYNFKSSVCDLLTILCSVPAGMTTDVFTGCARHDNQLHARCGKEHLTKVRVLQRSLFDVDNVTCHYRPSLDFRAR
jgi:hypothetical protein